MSDTIERAESKDYYMQIAAHAHAIGNKLNISLEEFLGLSFKEDKPLNIDPELDEKMRVYLEKRMKEKADGRQ